MRRIDLVGCSVLLLSSVVLMGCPAAFANDRVVTKIIELTNAEREKKGLEPYKVNEQLSEAALAHARNMARQRRMTHVLDGETPADRVKRAKYPMRAVGENVARGYRSPVATMRGWMKSPGHRKNILSSKFTEIGVAVAYGADGKPYYCQVFGRPK